jgi:hypothetical protein
VDITPEKAVHTLRTADPSSLFYYSQHIAEVLESLIEERNLFQSLLQSLDEIQIVSLSDNLLELLLKGKMLKSEVKNLLKEFANAQDEEFLHL